MKLSCNIHNDFFAAKAKELAINSLFRSLPVAMYWMDKSGYFLGGNDLELKILNLKSIDALIGRHSNEFASPEAWDNSQKVITSNQAAFFKEKHVSKQGKNYFYLSIKSPWIVEDDIIGLYGVSIDVTSVLGTNEIMPNSVDIYDGLLVKNNKKFYLSEKWKDIYLTKREAECTYYLVNGKSAKETAKILNISPKSVEFYIEQVKIKLGCYKTSEVIEIILSDNMYNSLKAFLFDMNGPKLKSESV